MTEEDQIGHFLAGFYSTGELGLSVNFDKKVRFLWMVVLESQIQIRFLQYWSNYCFLNSDGTTPSETDVFLILVMTGVSSAENCFSRCVVSW